MRCDGRDNTKKLRSFISIVVPSKKKNENKNPLNGYSHFEKSLFYNKCSYVVTTIIKMMTKNNDKNSNNNNNNNNNNNSNSNNNNSNNNEVNNNDSNRKYKIIIRNSYIYHFHYFSFC